MSNSPFFSLIIPSYNRAHFISFSIESVLKQTYTDFELIIVDDGSTDNTEEIVKSFNDTRIHYYKKKNEERGAARNYGTKKSRGQYLNFFDSDDLLYPHHLKTAFEFVKNKNNPEVFHLGYEIKNDENKVQKKINNIRGDIKNILLNEGNILSCNGVFLQRNIALQFNFNEDRGLSGSEDYELWLRLAARYKIHFSNTITSIIINHSARSVLVTEKNKLLKRIHLLISYIYKDAEFNRKFMNYKNLLEASSFTYVAIHLALSKHKLGSLKYLFLALLKYPPIIITKRFFAIIKRLIL